MTPDITTLAERFRTVRARTERATSAIGEADQTIQSMPDASPTKWHRAHTTWFFDTFVVGGEKRRKEEYQPLQNTDPMGIDESRFCDLFILCGKYIIGNFRLDHSGAEHGFTRPGI